MNFRKTFAQLDRPGKILPFLMMLATRTPRYLPEIEWSDKSWTHNVFRLYELIFWRRQGIRAEMSMSAYQDWKGKTIVTYRAHSFEAVFALAEQYVRGFFKKFELVRIEIPQFAPVDGGLTLRPNPFMFAVAFDTSGEGLQAGSSTVTLSFTCTGSNRFLASERGVDNPIIGSQTYYSVSMTAAVTDQLTQGAATLECLDYLSNPASGANNLVLSKTLSSGGASIDAASYTGVKQSSQPSASNSVSPANTGSPLSVSVTTVDDNSWIIVGFGISGAASSGTNCTKRQQDLSYHGAGIADTNSAQTPTGSKTMTLTYSATLWQNCYAIAISPFVAVTDTNFMMMF